MATRIKIKNKKLIIDLPEILNTSYLASKISHAITLLASQGADYTISSDTLRLSLSKSKKYFFYEVPVNQSFDAVNHNITIVNNTTKETNEILLVQKGIPEIFKIEEYHNSFVEAKYKVYEIELTNISKKQAIKYAIDASDVIISNSEYSLHSIRNTASLLIRIKILLCDLHSPKTTDVLITVGPKFEYKATIKSGVDHKHIIKPSSIEVDNEPALVDTNVEYDGHIEYQTSDMTVHAAHESRGKVKLKYKPNHSFNSKKVKIRSKAGGVELQTITVNVEAGFKINAIRKGLRTVTFNFKTPEGGLFNIREAMWVVNGKSYPILFNGEAALEFYDAGKSTLVLGKLAEDAPVRTKKGIISFRIVMGRTTQNFIYNLK